MMVQEVPRCKTQEHTNNQRPAGFAKNKSIIHVSIQILTPSNFTCPSRLNPWTYFLNCHYAILQAIFLHLIRYRKNHNQSKNPWLICSCQKIGAILTKCNIKSAQSWIRCQRIRHFLWPLSNHSARPVK